MTQLEIKHSIECTNGNIDIKVTNGTRTCGKLQEYPITVKKKFGEYHYSDSPMFSPDNWLSNKEKKELTKEIEGKYNITIE